MTDRAVFDCMLFLQAAINRKGPAFACFRLVEQGRATLCVSSAVLAEVKEVLARPDLQAKFPNLTPERVKHFLSEVEGYAVSVADVANVFSLPRDPEDEPYINLAIAAGAKSL